MRRTKIKDLFKEPKEQEVLISDDFALIGFKEDEWKILKQVK